MEGAVPLVPPPPTTTREAYMGRPRKYPQTRTLVAIESGIWMSPEGEEYPFRAGETLVAEDHPLARANPAWFTEVETMRQRPAVEETTAAPGELRGE